MNGIFWFLIKFWLCFGIMGFAAGAAALGDGGDGGEGAIEPGSEGAESVEGSEGGEEPLVEGSEGAESAEPKIDANLPLYKAAKAELEAIKAKNPALAKKIQTALIRADQMDKALPDGFQKAAAILKDLPGLAYPGSEGQTTEQILQNVRAEVQGWRDFDVKISKGDPSIIEELVTATPEGFQNLIPAALNKYAELNPDAYSALVSQAVVSHMNQSEIPLQLRMMETFIPRLPDSPEKNELIAAYNGIAKWVEALKGFAAKPITPVKGKTPENGNQPNAEAQQAAREVDITRREWNTRSTPYGYQLISSETSRIVGATKLTPQQTQQVTAKVAEELDARLIANKEYGAAMRAFLSNKNYEGYKRRLHSEYHRLIPGAVRRAVDDLGIKTGKAAPVKAAVKAGPGNIRPVVKQESTFEKIAGNPRTIQGMPPIDLIATSATMIANRQAILKGGKRVRW